MAPVMVLDASPLRHRRSHAHARDARARFGNRAGDVVGERNRSPVVRLPDEGQRARLRARGGHHLGGNMGTREDVTQERLEIVPESRYVGTLRRIRRRKRCPRSTLGKRCVVKLPRCAIGVSNRGTNPISRVRKEISADLAGHGDVRKKRLKSAPYRGVGGCHQKQLQASGCCRGRFKSHGQNRDAYWKSGAVRPVGDIARVPELADSPAKRLVWLAGAGLYY